MCCWSKDNILQDLSDKINVLLALVKARKVLLNDLAILPTVLVGLVLEYTTCDIPPNRSISNLEKTVRAQCLIS